MIQLFTDAGVSFMIALTILFLSVIIAAWKAPRWVGGIGRIALVSGIIVFLVRFCHLLAALNGVSGEREDVAGIFDLISPDVLLTGIVAYTIPVVYGLIIYLVSLIIRLFQKPRF